MSSDEKEYSRERFEVEKREFEKQMDSLSYVPLGSLAELYHFAELKILYCPPERYLHGMDLLNAISCHKDISTLNYACVQSAKNGGFPIEKLIVNEGADMNLCDEYGLTSFACFAKYERRTNRINDILRIFFKQVHKLKAVGLHVHPQNQRQYEIILSRDDMQHFVDQQLKLDYNDELDRMNKFALEEGLSLTLADVFREEIDLTPAMYIFHRMIVPLEQDQMNQLRFPLLWGLVKLRYHQLVRRRQWKPLVTDALRILTQQKLPQNCVDAITKGLENYDLANLLMVAFNMCLKNYKSARQARKLSNHLSFVRSPRKMLLRI